MKTVAEARAAFEKAQHAVFGSYRETPPQGKPPSWWNLSEEQIEATRRAEAANAQRWRERDAALEDLLAAAKREAFEAAALDVERQSGPGPISKKEHRELAARIRALGSCMCPDAGMPMLGHSPDCPLALTVKT